MQTSTQLELASTKLMYQRLLANQDKPINYDDTIIRDINGSKTFQEAFCCTDPIYLTQIQSLQGHNPTVIKPGTVAAYLYGCFLTTSPSPELACTPSCLTGLKNPELDGCNQMVYEKIATGGTGGTLTRIYTPSPNLGTFAYVYTYEALKPNEINKLYRDGIRQVSVYMQYPDSITYAFYTNMDIVPQGGTAGTGGMITTMSTDTTTTTPTSAQVWGWILGIVILVIIIAIIAWIIRSTS